MSIQASAKSRGRRRLRVTGGLVAFVALTLLTSSATIASPRYAQWSEPQKVPGMINSAASENGPAISKDALTIYFTSTRPNGHGGEDVWVSYRATTASAWGAPVNLAPLNTAINDRVPALSPDGHWMFFARGTSLATYDLWASYRSHTHDDFGPFGWQPPQPLTSLNTSTASETAPAYCEGDGGPQLYFASDRAGGGGDFDIYVASRQPDGSWGDVMNVADVNTTSQEARPTLSHNCDEIIFHSDRRLRMNLDLYSARRDPATGHWSAPEPLSSLNTAAQDGQPALSADGETLYFFSNRPNPLGTADLWVSTRTKATGKP